MWLCAIRSSGLSWPYYCPDVIQLLSSTLSDFSSVRFSAPSLIGDRACIAWRLRKPYRSCGKWILSWNALHYWFLVSKGWARKAFLHFSNKQRHSNHGIRLFNDWCVQSWRRKWPQRLAMVKIGLKQVSGESVLGLWIDRLFVMDGIISLPIAVIGFFILPDVPEISNPWYLSKQVRSVLPRMQLSFRHLIVRIRRLHYHKKEWSLKGERKGNHIPRRRSRKSLRHGTSISWLSYLRM